MGKATKLRNKDIKGRNYWIEIRSPADSPERVEKQVNVYRVGSNVLEFMADFREGEIDLNLRDATKWSWCISANNGGYRRISAIYMLQKHISPDIPRKKDTYKTVFMQDEIDTKKFTKLEFELNYEQQRRLVRALASRH